MNSLNPNYFIDAANVVMLVAYSVRDVLWLRLLAMASSLILIPYFALQQRPPWVPIGWSVVFVAINLFQSWRILVERRPVKLTPEEEKVRPLVFEDLSPRKALQVMNIGTWSSQETGELLIEPGKSVEKISLIIHGRVRVSRDKRVLGELTSLVTWPQKSALYPPR